MATRLSLTLLTLALVPLLTGCGNKDKISDEFFPMGGIPMRITGFDVSQSKFDETFERIKSRTEELEGLLSKYIKDTDISRLNDQGKATVSEDTLVVLEKAMAMCVSTDGAFDITMAPVLEIWQRAAKSGKAPQAEELASALERVGCRKLEISHSQSRVTMTTPGMEVDLGGIAKGYIIGEAAELMKKGGISKGIVDAGGDVVLFSGKGDQSFRVGIRDPLSPSDAPKNIAVLSLSDGAVVTSGCYERYFELDGEKICHIIDPRTGQPAKGPLSVTVVARDASSADAYATALYVLGEEDGFSLAKSLPDVDAVFLVDDGKGGVAIKATPGLAGKLELLKEE